MRSIQLMKFCAKRMVASWKGATIVGTGSIHWRAHIEGRGGVTVADGARVAPGAELQTKSGSIRVGEHSAISSGVIVRADDGEVNVGERCSIMFYTVIYGEGSVTIGNDVLIGNHCLISSVDHTWEGRKAVADLPMRMAPVTIEDGVWLGAYTAVMAGVTIGECAIVGSHSLVKDDVPPYSIFAGTPARLIGMREARVPEATDE